MGLKKIFLRYHPPGITLEYTRQGEEKKKEIDLYGNFEDLRLFRSLFLF